jgi:ankyrin repeat protein
LENDPDLAGARDAGGLSAVLTALYYGFPDIADLLIERGAPLNLFEASAAGRVDAVRETLDAAPRQVNAWAPDGFQPLGLASFFGHTELARLLVERGAEINSPSHNLLNVQPLHSAVAGQHLEIAALLLDHGADANARQGEGFVPLHSAAQNGQIAMIELLLAHGADPRVKNDAGKTPREIALESGHLDAAELLG